MMTDVTPVAQAVMVEVIEAQSGQKPEQLLADSGYCSEQNLGYLAEKGIDGYVATEKQKHGTKVGRPKLGPLPPNATLVDRMRRKLQTKRGSMIYAARKTIVEPVFGQIKQGRGFRQFLLRTDSSKSEIGVSRIWFFRVFFFSFSSS